MSISHDNRQLISNNKYSKIWRVKSQDSYIELKSLKTESAPLKEFKKLQHEYEILSKLTSQDVIRPLGFDTVNSILTLEDFYGKSLFQIINEVDSIQKMLILAIELARGLGDIHHQQVIHKDINPYNILVSPDLQIKYIDFGIASLLSKETNQISNPSAIEGTLAYISPEQTGRLNQPLDYRSDIYSLGVTLYQLFTKRLPFMFENPLDLIHAHIAADPIPPHEINSNIPKIVSDIILKCMSKTSEQRYKGAFGLKADLIKCLTQLNASNRIEEFELAEADVLDHFELPTKLYGRENEISLAAECYQRIAQGKKEALLIEGVGGIGKTRLITEISKLITSKNGHFVKGDFIQFKKHVPYHGVIEVIKKLVAELLLKDEAALALWREKILTAVGDAGQLLVEIVPQIKLIIGEQPAVPKLGAEETLYRFNFILTNFLEIFPSKDNTLAICLENIQWVDDFSIKFFEYFLSSVNSGYFLFIVSYRDNEAGPLQNFSLMMDRLRNTGFPISTMKVNPLPIDAVNELIQDCFKTLPEETLMLAQISHKKTQGNPFFLGRFLKLLNQRGLLEFDPEIGRWVPNIDEIKTLEISDNVGEILAQKIKTLNSKTQRLLIIGSALGSTFDIVVASSLLNVSKVQAAELMISPLEEELVAKTTLENGSVTYTFLHDRIQQAAYSLVKSDEKEQLHYSIAKKLLEIIPEDALSDKIIDVVDHFNEGLKYVVTADEKDKVSYYNFLAGEKAKNSAEFARALNYFKISLKLLGTNAWETNYDVCSQLYLGLALSERMAGNKSHSEKFFDTLISHARTKLDKSKFITEKMILHMQEMQYDKALSAGFESLELFGYHIPRKITKLRAMAEYFKVNLLTHSFENKDLLNLPPVKNKEVEVILFLLNEMVYNSYLIGETMLSLYLILKMYHLTIKYGMSEQGTVALALYAGGLSWIRIRKYEKGFELGQIALTLSKRYPHSFVAVQVPFQVYLYSNRWGNSLRSNTEPLKSILRWELELGNITYAGTSATICIFYSILAGIPLNKVISDINEMIAEFNKLQITSPSITLTVMRNFAMAMRSNDFGNSELLYDNLPVELIKLIQQQDNYQISDNLFNHFIYAGFNLILNYFNGNLERVLQIGEPLVAKSTIFGNNPVWNSIFLYYPLAALELYKVKKDKSLLKIFYKYQKIYKRWAEASSNYVHGYHLMCGELAKSEGKYQVAIHHFEVAIENAKAGEFFHEEALCNERLAYLYLEIGESDKATDYLKQAIIGYGKWDAPAKADALKKKYRSILELEDKNEIANTNLQSVSPATISSNADSFDIATLMSASQAISKEIFLDKLVETMLRIVAVNAGASKVFLILESHGELVVKAAEIANTVEILNNIPLKTKENELCISAINMVIRTNEQLVIDDAYNDGGFSKDIYVNAAKARSLAVIPLLQHATLTGILYLENTATVGAFTVERLRLIQFLSNQMAISIENAKFYADLEEKITDRTKEIKLKNDELTKTVNLLHVTQDQLVLQEKLKEREAVKNKLGRYVPNSQVLDLILKNVDLVSTEKEVTILFCDIRDFTSLSERYPAAETVKLLNDYFTRMAHHIQKNKGILDKYIGDGFMAIFGALESDSLHSLNAVNAAVDMLNDVESFSNERMKQGKPTIKIGVGINTGKVIMGNIGSSDRIDYTAIGDTVNVASRVESLTKVLKCQLLVTENTKLLMDNTFQTIDKGSYPLKGKSLPIHVFEVVIESRRKS